MTLGKRIKRIRTYRGMTQRELGIRLGYKDPGRIFGLHSMKWGIANQRRIRCIKWQKFFL